MSCPLVQHSASKSKTYAITRTNNSCHWPFAHHHFEWGPHWGFLVVCSAGVFSNQPDLLSDWLSNWPICSLIGRAIGLILDLGSKRNCTWFLLQDGRANGVSGPYNRSEMPLSSISDHVFCWSPLLIKYAEYPPAKLLSYPPISETTPLRSCEIRTLPSQSKDSIRMQFLKIWFLQSIKVSDLVVTLWFDMRGGFLHL